MGHCATTVVTKDTDDLCVPKHNTPKGDNHCLQLQHRGQGLSTGTQWGSQRQLSKALPAGDLGALHEGDGTSPSSRGDNSLLLVGFTQGKFHETRLLLQDIRESNGNPQQPHRTQLRVKLSRGNSALPSCVSGMGLGDMSSAARLGHPSTLCPRALWHKS